MGKTTSVERMRKLRKKLKEAKPNEYKIHLEKERQRDRKRRENMKRKETTSTRLMAARRLKETERKRKYRQKKKENSKTAYADAMELGPLLGSYSCVQSLGKAVGRVKKMLPCSPRKKTAVIKKLVYENFNKFHAKTILPNDMEKKEVKHALSEETIEKVETFYQRDDISCQSPGIKDIKTIKNPKIGERVLYQKRYMNMAVKEAYSLFVLENPDIKVKIAKFYDLRPTYVLLTSEMPHNVCVCKYHSNFNYIVEALNKKVQYFPNSGAKLLELICCDIKNEKCMLGNCSRCTTDLLTLIEEDVSCNLTWSKWTEIEGHSKIVATDGTLEEAVHELNSQLFHFKTHVYVKRIQSQTFIEVKQNLQAGEVVLQIDFAENYSAITQDEIQSAHWSHKQITVFTACAWLPGGEIRSFAIVTDVLSHDKYAVFACLKIIISELKQELNDLGEIKIFSDGAASQFKNRFTLTNLCFMPDDFNVEGEWYFFATSHGKGAVDGIGAVVKRAVWSRVKQRKVQIDNAKDFVEAACSSVKNVKIIHLLPEEVEINKEMLDERWRFVIGIDKLQSLHFLKGYNKESLIVGRTFWPELSKFRVFKLNFSDIYPESDSGSAACETSPLDSSKGMVPIKAPTVADITAGCFLLVEFTTSKSKKADISIKYRYAGIAQTSIEDDGEVKVMFLRNVRDSGNQFKTNEKDISFVTFDQILGILPTPEIKNVRNSIFYKFSGEVDVYEL